MREFDEFKAENSGTSRESPIQKMGSFFLFSFFFLCNLVFSLFLFSMSLWIINAKWPQL